MAHANATFVRYFVAAFVAFAISAVCVVAGFWQYDRHEARSAAIALFDANSTLPDSGFGSLAASAPESVEWRSAAAHGAFVPSSATVLRNRSVEGTRADQVLAWFVTDDGLWLLVNAGWTTIGAGGDVALPREAGTIEFMLRVTEPDDGKGADGSATRITTHQMPTAEAPVAGMYGVRLGGCSAADCLTVALEPVPPPRLSLGPHFAYAVQWWLFALLAPIGAFALARRDPRRLEHATAARKTLAPGASRSPSDEEIEDAL